MSEILWLVLFLVALFFIHSGFKYTRMIGRIFSGLVYEPRVDFPGSARGERVTILVSSDQEIETLFVESPDSKKIALFCHESGGAVESWEKYASFLPSFGYHVLSVDLKGPSPGEDANSFAQWPTIQEVKWLLAVIRWTKKAFRPDVEVVLFGVSKGADVAFAASFHDESVKAVVADGLFSMKEIFREHIRKWAPLVVKPNLFGERYPAWIVDLFTNLGFWYCQRKSGRKFVDVEPLLKKRHVPLLAIHGENDEYVLRSHRDLLERLNNKRARLERLVVPGAGHNEAVTINGRLYEYKIVEFLKVL